MIRRSFKGALSAAVLLPFLTACPPNCEKPTVGRTTFDIRQGQTLTLTAGDIFNGVCGRDCVKGFRITSQPSFIDARDGNGSVVLDATGMSGDVRSGVGMAGRLRDTMSVEVDTKCGSATADLTINVLGPPPRMAQRPAGPEILVAAPAAGSAPSPVGGAPVSFTAVEPDEHF